MSIPASAIDLAIAAGIPNAIILLTASALSFARMAAAEFVSGFNRKIGMEILETPPVYLW